MTDDGSYACPTKLAVTVRPWADDQVVEVTDDATSGQLSVPDGQSAVLEEVPTQGSVTLNPDGSFSYQRGEGKRWLDSFTYKLTGVHGDSNIGTVRLELLHADFPYAVILAEPHGHLVGPDGGPPLTLDYPCNPWNIYTNQHPWHYSWDDSPEFSSRDYNCYLLSPQAAARYTIQIIHRYSNGGSGTWTFNADSSYTYVAGAGNYGEVIECVITDGVDSSLPFYIQATVDRTTGAPEDSFTVWGSDYRYDQFWPEGTSALHGTFTQTQLTARNWQGQSYNLVAYTPDANYAGFDVITGPDPDYGNSYETALPPLGSFDLSLQMSYYAQHGMTVEILETYDDHVWARLFAPSTFTSYLLIPANSPILSPEEAVITNLRGEDVLQDGEVKVDLGQTEIGPTVATPTNDLTVDAGSRSSASESASLGEIGSVEIVEGPKHGTLTELEGTTYIYRPDAGFVGNDYIDYKTYVDYGFGGGACLIVRCFFYVTPSGPGLAVDTANIAGDNDPLETASVATDKIEDDADKTGKIVSVDAGDSDSDGIPDSLDGYNADDIAGNADDQSAGSHFAPVVWDYLRDSYYAYMPAATWTFTFSGPAADSFRLWKKDGSEARSLTDVADGGDLIVPGVAYTADELGLNPWSSDPLRMWMEALKPSQHPGDLRISLSFDPDGTSGPAKAITDAVRMTAMGVSLHIDSNNDGTITAADDAIKDDPTKPGKIIQVNDDDPTGEGVPNYLLGYGMANVPNSNMATAGVHFAPVKIVLSKGLDYSKVKLTFVYNASDPVLALYNGPCDASPDDGTLRLWTKDGSVLRSGKEVDAGGNFVGGNTAYTAAELGFSDSQTEITLYVEAVRPSESRGDQTIRVKVDLPGLPDAWEDEVRLTVLKAQIAFNCASDSQTLRPTTPDASFTIDAQDERFREYNGGLKWWWADSGGAVTLNSLQDFTPLRVQVPSMFGQNGLGGSLRLTMSYIGDDGLEVDLLANPRLTSNRSAFLSDPTMAGNIVDPAGGTSLTIFACSGGVRTITKVLSVLPGDNEFLIRGVGHGIAKVKVTLQWVGMNDNVIPLETATVTFKDIKTMYSEVSARGADADHEIKSPTVDFQYQTEDGRSVSTKVYPYQWIRNNMDQDVKSTFLFIHGYNVDWEHAEAAFDTMYKRMYWQGFRGNFIGFSWYGNEYQVQLVGTTPLFDPSVSNALHTSGTLWNFIHADLFQRDIGASDLDIGAHSLGNLVMWDALRLNAQRTTQPMVHNVLSIEAAVWEEAFWPEGSVTYSALNADGSNGTITYSATDLEKNSWAHWFNPGDVDIRTAIDGEVFNSYYAGDQALGIWMKVNDWELHDGNPVQCDHRHAFRGAFVNWRTLDNIVALPSLIRPSITVSSACTAADTTFPVGMVPSPLPGAINIDAASLGWANDHDSLGHSAFTVDDYPEIYGWFAYVFRAVGRNGPAAISIGVE